MPILRRRGDQPLARWQQMIFLCISHGLMFIAGEIAARNSPPEMRNIITSFVGGAMAVLPLSAIAYKFVLESLKDVAKARSEENEELEKKVSALQTQLKQMETDQVARDKKRDEEHAKAMGEVNTKLQQVQEQLGKQLDENNMLRDLLANRRRRRVAQEGGETTLKGSLLIVDDIADTRDLLKIALEKNGYFVAVADGGISGFQHYNEAKSDRMPFDLVILDYDMPGMDGEQVLRKIRESGDETTKVAFLTGKGNLLDDRPPNAFPAQVWLKPVEPKDLCRCIAALLAGEPQPVTMRI